MFYSSIPAACTCRSAPTRRGRRPAEKGRYQDGTRRGGTSCAPPDGQRARVHDVSRIARKPASAEEAAQLCFAAFDLIEVNGDEITGKFAETWKRISTIRRGRARGSRGNQDIERAKGVLEAFENGRRRRRRRCRARSDEKWLVQDQAPHTFDLTVLGFAEGTDDRAGMLHDLLLGIAVQTAPGRSSAAWAEVSPRTSAVVS